MKGMMWSIAMLVAVVLPAAVGAQSGTMAKGDKMDTMEMKDATYTGCVAAGTAAGTFTLTHVAADTLGKKAVQKDTMKKDTIGTDAMGEGSRLSSRRFRLAGPPTPKRSPRRSSSSPPAGRAT